MAGVEGIHSGGRDDGSVGNPHTRSVALEGCEGIVTEDRDNAYVPRARTHIVHNSLDRTTIIFLTCISAMVCGIPPTPRPACRRPANGIQLTRNAV